MSFPAELADGFSYLSSSRMSVNPRLARCRAVDDPIVPPPPTMRILLSVFASRILGWVLCLVPHGEDDLFVSSGIHYPRTTPAV
jgi:hypothetical protein